MLGLLGQGEAPPVNWGKVGAGIGIFFVVDVLFVGTFVLAGLSGGVVLEATMLLTETPMVLALGGAVVYLNVKAWNLVGEGIRGE